MGLRIFKVELINFLLFVSGYLLTCPSFLIPEYELFKLKKLALNYEKYPSMSIELRRRIIVRQDSLFMIYINMIKYKRKMIQKI